MWPDKKHVWRPIPGYPGYVARYTSQGGTVRTACGRLIHVATHGPNLGMVRVCDAAGTWRLVPKLDLVLAAWPEMADIPVMPRSRGDKQAQLQKDYADLRSVRSPRKCHDCGAPTANYRCPRCLAKWRKKHGVCETADEEDGLW